jgi:hypothetical protein
MESFDAWKSFNYVPTDMQYFPSIKYSLHIFQLEVQDHRVFKFTHMTRTTSDLDILHMHGDHGYDSNWIWIK